MQEGGEPTPAFGFILLLFCVDSLTSLHNLSFNTLLQPLNLERRLCLSFLISVGTHGKCSPIASRALLIV